MARAKTIALVMSSLGCRALLWTWLADDNDRTGLACCWIWKGRCSRSWLSGGWFRVCWQLQRPRLFSGRLDLAARSGRRRGGGKVYRGGDGLGCAGLVGSSMLAVISIIAIVSSPNGDRDSVLGASS